MERLLRGLFNDEVGTSARAGRAAGRAPLSVGVASIGRREVKTLSLSGGGSDGGIVCGEAGCLHCGFTSVNSRPLFTTIINCSIIQMIFTRANYTGPCRENGLWVFYCCIHRQQSALVRLFKQRQKSLAGLISSLGVSPQWQRLL